MESESGLVSVIAGIRSQYIKLAAFQRALAPDFRYFQFIDTGQHYDASLAAQYIEEYQLRFDIRLEAAARGSPPGRTFANMIAALDAVFNEAPPRAVVVFGDANTTLAAAVAAGRLGIPVAHIEAGLRTGARTIEEFNRTITDRISSLHLASCQRDYGNLESEGYGETAYFVGDLVRDLCAEYVGDRDDLESDFALVSLHRAEHTDSPWLIERTVRSVLLHNLRVVFLAHPRVLPLLEGLSDSTSEHMSVAGSVRHRELLELLVRARLVVTDSGALQRESFYVGCRAVVVQERPFWPSLVDAGFHVSVAPFDDIGAAVERALQPAVDVVNDFGEVPVAPKVVDILDGWVQGIERH